MAVNSYGQEMLDKYISYKHRVNNALENGQIFRIVGEWPRLRQELGDRGWIEKKVFPSDNPVGDLPHSILLQEAFPGNEYERALIARMVGRHRPDFIWLANGKYYYRYRDCPIVNRIYLRDCNFGSKDGLQVYYDKMDYGLHPRGYNLIGAQNLDIFIEDFCLTASTALVLYLDNHQSLTERFVENDSGVSWASILVVLSFVQAHIDNAEYGMEVLMENSKNSGVDDKKYQVILSTYQQIIKQNKKIQTYFRNAPQDHIPIIRRVAQKVRETWPQRIHDG